MIFDAAGAEASLISPKPAFHRRIQVSIDSAQPWNLRASGFFTFADAPRPPFCRRAQIVDCQTAMARGKTPQFDDTGGEQRLRSIGVLSEVMMKPRRDLNDA